MFKYIKKTKVSLGMHNDIGIIDMANIADVFIVC